MRWYLNGIANRIDVGYNIDVRAGAPTDDEDENIPSSFGEALQTIRAASLNLRFINRTGEPILSLPEGGAAPEAWISQDQPKAFERQPCRASVGALTRVLRSSFTFFSGSPATSGSSSSCPRTRGASSMSRSCPGS